jgi:hypothetical protein
MSTDGIDENEVYDVLRNERRREVLRRLAAADGTSTIGDLADGIAAAEADESPPPSDVRQSVYVSLHQTHLPKLDNLDVVRYDRDDRGVELLARGRTILERMEVDDDSDPSRAAVAVLIPAVLGLLVGLVGLAGVPGIAGVAATAGTTLALLVVAAVGAVLRWRPDLLE